MQAIIKISQYPVANTEKVTNIRTKQQQQLK